MGRADYTISCTSNRIGWGAPTYEGVSSKPKREVQLHVQYTEGREQEIKEQCERVVEELGRPLTFRGFKWHVGVVFAGGRVQRCSLSFLVHVDESVKLSHFEKPLNKLVEALSKLDGVTSCGFHVTGEVKFVGVQTIGGMKFIGEEVGKRRLRQ